MHARGQSLTEYLTIGAMVLVVAIGAIAVLGGSISKGLTGMLANPEQIRAARLAASNSPGQHTPVVSVSGSGTLSNATPSSDLRSAVLGTGVDPNLPQGFSKTIQTVGANGTTELLAQKLETLAKQLLADGTISQAQSDLLMRLANQGHGMADVEKLIENYVKSGGDPEGGAIAYQGKTYTAQDLRRLVGYETQGPGNIKNPFTPNSDGGTAVTQFQSIYQQVQSSGLLSNPEVKAAVDNASSQIVMIGELVDDSYSAYLWGDLNPSQPNFFTNSMASSATNLHSSTICKSGNFKDNLAMCQ